MLAQFHCANSSRPQDTDSTKSHWRLYLLKFQENARCTDHGSKRVSPAPSRQCRRSPISDPGPSVTTWNYKGMILALVRTTFSINIAVSTTVFLWIKKITTTPNTPFGTCSSRAASYHSCTSGQTRGPLSTLGGKPSAVVSWKSECNFSWNCSLWPCRFSRAIE